MKRHVLILLSFIVVSFTHGQISGAKTIPGDYGSVAEAIVAINSQGVGPGGVLINVAAGHTETFPSPSSGRITASGTSDDLVIFQKSGNGNNPTITACSPGTGAMDYIICFDGADYITFDGIDLCENVSNTTPVSQMEWGFSLLKASGTNGSQHISIKNCSISLNKANSATYAIYSNNHSTFSTTPLVISDFSGTNSANSFYGLTISNCYNAIFIKGYEDSGPYNYYDHDNAVGVFGTNLISGLGNSSGTLTSCGIYCAFQDGLNISENSFTGNVGNSAGSLYAIYLSTGINSDIDVYNNTVSMTYLGTGAFYGIYCSGMGAAGTSNTANFYGNSIINNAIPNFSGSMLGYIYISTGCVSSNFYNNNVSGNIAGSSSATANGTIYYTYLNSTPGIAGVTNIYQNYITNNARIQSSPGNGSTYILYNTGSGNILNEMQNTIDSITISSTGSTYCLYNLFSGAVKNVYKNTISHILNAKGSLYGIYNGNGNGAGYFYNNEIHNLSTNSISGKIYGIYQSSGTNQYHYNNFISELYAPQATNNPAIFGLYLSGNLVTGAYNNTIYLDASSSGAGFGVTGIYANTTTMVDLRNNLVVNNSVPGIYGRVVAYQRSNSTLTTYSELSNNNNLYAGVPGPSHLIYFDGVNSESTLSGYIARVSPKDANSVTEFTSFENTSNHPFDLHVLTNLPSQCESGGSILSSPVNIIDDIDGDARYPNDGYPYNIITGPLVNAPDIGADEFGGLVYDVTYPDIKFCPLSNTSGTGNRVLTTTITDATGIPTVGTGLPVLYWKINNGAYMTVTAASLGGSQYSFTFGAGVEEGDIISYFIVAQDMVSPNPNVGADPMGGAEGFSASPPACSIPPVQPYTYLIVNSLAGTYTVGTGQYYPTLTSAINDINTKDIIAPVTLELWDEYYGYNENFPIVINSYAGMDDDRTITIKPKSGISVIVSGSSSTGVLAINGADNIIIDGAGGSDGTERALRFENTSTEINSYVIGLFNNGYKGAQNNTIKNCVIKAGNKNVQTWAILLNASGGDYDNTIIKNNELLNAMTGIQFVGLSLHVTNDGLVEGNLIGCDDNAITIGNVGIHVSNVDGLEISGNIIKNIFTGLNPKGINIGLNTLNTSITGNIIDEIVYAGTAGSGGKGIDVNTGLPESNLSIINNSISRISGDGWSTFGSNSIVGIRLLGSSGGINVFFNSISLTGTIFRPAATNDVSAAFYAASNVTDLDVRNNIFSNTLYNNNGISKAYAIFSDAPYTSYTKINYNDYNAGGPQGFLGYLGGVRNSLASWQSASMQDEYSLDMNPFFVSPTDLVPSNLGMNNMGIYMDAISADLSGTLRTDPPDMGANEFGTNPGLVSLAASDITCGGAMLNGSVNANGLTVQTYFDYGPDLSYGNTTTGNPATVTGSSPVPVSASLDLAPLTTVFYRLRTVTSDGVTSFSQGLSFTTLDSDMPYTVTNEASPVGENSATLNGQVNAHCNLTTVYFEYGLSSNYGNSIPANIGTIDGDATWSLNAEITGLEVNTTYHFRCVAQNQEGIMYGEDMAFVTLCPPPPAPDNINGPTSVCRVSDGHVYSINPLPYADEYFWTLPPGGTITSGENTFSITVSYGENALPGNVTVYGTGIGGEGVPSSLYVNVNPLPVPTISGNSIACVSSTYIYSTEEGMSDYSWMISGGGQIMSGQGTGEIQIYWESIGNHSISVTYTSQAGCQAAEPALLDIMVSPLPEPTVAGSNVVCAGAGYYIYTTQEGFLNYNWVVSEGGTIISGQGTYQVDVEWAGYGEQSISVNYANVSGCFAPEPAIMEVSVLSVPGLAGEITGSHELCSGTRELIYSVDAIPYAISYIWSLPPGAVISAGENTNIITIDFSLDAESGTITVYGQNDCGAGEASPEFAVTIYSTPETPVVTMNEENILHSSAPDGNQWYRDGIPIEGATGQDYQAEMTGFYHTVVTLDNCPSGASNIVEVNFVGTPETEMAGFAIYPVPNKGQITLKFKKEFDEIVTIWVYDALGIKKYEAIDIHVRGEMPITINLNGPRTGIYTVIIRGRSLTLSRKILVAI